MVWMAFGIRTVRKKKKKEEEEEEEAKPLTKGLSKK